MLELVQFRRRTVQRPVTKDTTTNVKITEYRQAHVVADPGGHLLVVTDEEGKVQYGEWQAIQAPPVQG